MDRKTEKLIREYPTFDPEFIPAAELQGQLEVLGSSASKGLLRRGRTGHMVIQEPELFSPKGRKIANFDHSADAHFVSALVNSWHAGRLAVMPMKTPLTGEPS
ncbi:MAG: hypothetical protein COB08_003255 [Rhodobacteraceae bacterium]|nr:hypothetical protein [Paracoccaceae bacterium]